jgi:DNA-binding SARP family transcriptional activator
MSHLLKLTLLGGFDAASSSGAVALPTKKTRALLAYCALRPGEVHQREKLATLLWGDTIEANARNSLRQALFLLRAALKQAKSSAFRIDGDTVTADPQAIDVDVLRFEQLVAKRTPAALEQAAALYRGDLLDGFVVDEEPFEQWLMQERERLRELALDALARLLRHQNSLEAADAATQTARRLLTLDPLQEAVHRVLMRLHVRSGRREAALRQYEVCVGLLRRELQLGPEPETRQLYEEILRTRERASAPAREEARPAVAAPAAPAQETPAVTTKQVHNGVERPAERRARPFPRSDPLWERYREKALLTQQTVERARMARASSSACLTASRQALMAARALNTKVLVATRQLAHSSVLLVLAGDTVDVESPTSCPSQ